MEKQPELLTHIFGIFNTKKFNTDFFGFLPLKQFNTNFCPKMGPISGPNAEVTPTVIPFEISKIRKVRKF